MKIDADSIILPKAPKKTVSAFAIVAENFDTNSSLNS